MIKIPRIGIWISPIDPYWVQISEAIYLRGQQLPVELVPLESTLEFAGHPDGGELKLSEDILSFGLSVLISTYITEPMALQIISRGLPVIQLTTSDLRHKGFISFEGYAESALLAGRFVAERLKGRGNTFVIGGLGAGGGEGGKDRVEAISSVFNHFPELIWQHIPAPWAYDQACAVIEKALKNLVCPVDALVGISDSLALAARDAAHRLNLLTPQTVIVGINGDPLALAAIAEGSLSATIDTDIANFGREAMDTAYNIVQGLPTPPLLRIRSSLVTAENVSELALKKLIAIADIPTRLVGINRRAEQFRLTQLETVAAINRQVGRLLQREKLLGQVVKLIREHYHYNQIYIYEWNTLGRWFRREYPQTDGGSESQIPLEQAGLISEVVMQGSAIFIPDSFHSLQYPSEAAYPRTRSRAILPIRYNKKLVGVLDLHSSQWVQHVRPELIGLQLLADQVGIAGQNAFLYEQSVQARAAAEKADRLKTLLLANVSHELRNPINLILGYSQMVLKEHPGLTHSTRKDINQIYQSGEHLMRLINDLLDMSRLEIDALELYPEVIEIGGFLEDVFRGMADTNRAVEIEWRLDLPENLPLVQADPVRLRQILLNLLSNAQRFTSRGQITLGAQVEPPHLHLWVGDTGAGITPEDQERIFEPFARGEQANRPEGIGLGLSITRLLVALHNGSMSLESHVGIGSTFHVYLPLPSLIGTAVPQSSNATEAVILLISHQSSPGLPILQLSQRLGLKIKRIALTEKVGRAYHPAMLAWDMATAHPSDWNLIAQLRQSPHLCRVPFVVFNQHSGVSGLTNILVKPVAQSTLLEVFDSLVPSMGIKNPILVVDDDPQARVMYERLLSEAFPNVSLQFASDGQVALDLLTVLTPSLVILDLMMPRVDGFTVLEYIRKETRLQLIPVLVMSGKLLTKDDARRLDYARVIFHSKDMLAPEEALAALRNVLNNSERLPQPTSALVKQIIAYLHQNYASALNRQHLARSVGVSERYLSEIFKQEIGLSPWEVLNRFRIQRARELLKTTDASITDIAAQVGFDDPSYFGRVFNQQMGVSPKKYRHT